MPLPRGAKPAHGQADKGKRGTFTDKSDAHRCAQPQIQKLQIRQCFRTNNPVATARLANLAGCVGAQGSQSGAEQPIAQHMDEQVVQWDVGGQRNNAYP